MNTTLTNVQAYVFSGGNNYLHKGGGQKIDFIHPWVVIFVFLNHFWPSGGFTIKLRGSTDIRVFSTTCKISNLTKFFGLNDPNSFLSIRFMKLHTVNQQHRKCAIQCYAIVYIWKLFILQKLTNLNITSHDAFSVLSNCCTIYVILSNCGSVIFLLSISSFPKSCSKFPTPNILLGQYQSRYNSNPLINPRGLRTIPLNPLVNPKA